ncbi:MAG: AtpZ/AtpI family protein [Bacteroidetes bacterium]|jgi:F0F1-type ATP synthase assembly protein I|nr:AtpZ/AtpI family protein [Bacteroidota bacterium]
MPKPTASGPERPPGGWWDDSLREFAPFVGLGLQLAAAVLVFFFIGWWVDNELGLTPWGRLAGVVVGTTGGMIKFIRTVTGPKFKDQQRPPHEH